MKIAVLSDIHANHLALEAVLSSLKQFNPDQIWFLGDAVGRGPWPVEVVNWVNDEMSLPVNRSWVLGNHDAMLANLLTEYQWGLVNVEPKEVINHHRMVIQKRNNGRSRKFIKSYFTQSRLQPRNHDFGDVKYILVHGNLADPAGYYSYMYSWKKYDLLPENFNRLNKTFHETGLSCILLFGHTHVPALISSNLDGQEMKPHKIIPGETYNLDPERNWLINPGSVGQPRDLDNRASYLLVDTEKNIVTFKRVSYPWEKVIRKLTLEGYPHKLELILLYASPDEETPIEWLDHYKKARQVADE